MVAVLKIYIYPSPEPKGQSTRNLIEVFGLHVNQKIAKIIPVGNPI